MKYSFSTIALLILLNSSVFCQKITLGKPYSKEKGTYKAYIQSDDGFVVINSTLKHTTTSKRKNKSLNSFPSNTKIKHPKFVYALERVVNLEDKHYALYTYFHAGKAEIYASQISLESADMTELKPICSIRGGAAIRPTPEENLLNPYYTGGTGNSGFRQLAQWDFRVSSDKRELLAARYSGNSLRLNLFNSNLKETWTIKIDELPSSLKDEETKILVNDFNIDKKNNTYLVTLAKTGQKQKVELCKINSDKKVSLIPLKIPQCHIKEAWIKKRKDGKLKCILAYSKDSDKYIIDGVAIGDFDGNKVTNISTTEFTPSFYDKKNWVGNHATNIVSYRFQLEKIIFQEDNSFICLFEFKHSDLQGNAINIKDNLIIKSNDDNSVKWTNVLPKNQQGSLSDFNLTGYKYAKSENYHYLFYTDSPQNSNEYDPNIPAKKYSVKNQKGILAYYKINDSSGKTIKQQIFKINDINGTSVSSISPKKIIQSNISSIVLEANKSAKEDVLIQVNLK